MNELTELVAKYVEGDDVGAAIVECDARNFKMMTSIPDGVPSGVMFAATMAGVRRTTSLLARMIVENRGIGEGWSEEQMLQQMALTEGAVTLMMGDSLNQTLNMMTQGKQL